jgi:ABC-type multidrug transport system fused ATPase/permease subunit
MPDYAKAINSATAIDKLSKTEPLIDNWSSSGQIIKPEDDDGTIRLDNVEFSYPTRKEATVLNKINLKINKGQRVGLVGSSGCGKSTVTQLIERFYDPDTGSITLSDKNLKDLDLFWLRSQIGIVSQEPILFDLSIRDNIAYGDNARNVPFEEIQEAAIKSNIHDFIINLPKVCAFKQFLSFL